MGNKEEEKERPKRLTATFVRNATRPGVYGDGGHGSHGLRLIVNKSANGGVRKSWAQRLTINGKATTIGLGPTWLVPLKEARQKALENRRAAATGRDPRGGDSPTLREAAEKVIALRIPSWRDGGRSEDQWRASLETYAYPKIGDKAVSEITSHDILAVLSPHWHERPETMRRVKQRLGAILAWSIAANYREDNPARGAVVASALPNNAGTKHLQALPPSEVPAALAVIDQTGAYPTTKLLMRWIALTACRSGEARNAVWEEIDLDRRVWTIPDDRTKTGKELQIPISEAGMAVLNEARFYADKTGLLFPSPTGRPLSNTATSKLLKENGIPAVTHGFRSSFRDWCAESGVSRELAELAIGHTVKGIEGAYKRTDALEARRPVMEQWGEFISASAWQLL